MQQSAVLLAARRQLALATGSQRPLSFQPLQWCLNRAKSSGAQSQQIDTHSELTLVATARNTLLTAAGGVMTPLLAFRAKKASLVQTGLIKDTCSSKSAASEPKHFAQLQA
jgi:hypothetical protein